jgi:hypothetical protein
MGLIKLYNIRKGKPENWRIVRELDGLGDERFKIQYKAWFGLWLDEQVTCGYSGSNHTVWYHKLVEADELVDRKIKSYSDWVISSDVKYDIINFK